MFPKFVVKMSSMGNYSASNQKKPSLTMIVLLFPPKAFFNNFVNTESRKGTKSEEIKNVKTVIRCKK